MNGYIRIEKLTWNTNGKDHHKVMIEVSDGETLSTHEAKIQEAWTTEIMCANAGYAGKMTVNEVVDNKIHTVAIWRK